MTTVCKRRTFFASAFPDDIELQLAGLLHDIDHILGCHPSMHGDVGARYLSDVMPPDVLDLIRLHVPAKRYLVATQPDYRDRLSPASAATLRSQGEISGNEAAEFLNHRLARRSIALRRADEQAKSKGIRVPGLSSWTEPLLTIATEWQTANA